MSATTVGKIARLRKLCHSLSPEAESVTSTLLTYFQNPTVPVSDLLVLCREQCYDRDDAVLYSAEIIDPTEADEQARRAVETAAEWFTKYKRVGVRVWVPKVENKSPLEDTPYYMWLHHSFIAVNVDSSAPWSYVIDGNPRRAPHPTVRRLDWRTKLYELLTTLNPGAERALKWNEFITIPPSKQYCDGSPLTGVCVKVVV